MKNGINLTGGLGDAYFLHFAHLYELEFLADGGVVEYELNGNNVWLPMDSLPVVNGPNGTLSSLYGNPLGGRMAFTGVSNGYMTTRYDLSSLHGNSVRIRFRMGLDDSFYDIGWYVDNVEMYRCIDPATLIYSVMLPTLRK
jgi:hypothetical protein